MGSIEEICEYLRFVLKNLKNKEIDKKKFNEIIENVSILSNNCVKTKQLIELNINYKLSANENNEDLSEESIDFMKFIDLLIRLICLLDNYNENEMISSNDSFTIELSLNKLISLTLIPYISQHFKQIDRLFLSNDFKTNIISDEKLISIQLILKICTILTKLLSSKSIISKSVREHCFASIIGSLMSLKHQSIESIDKTSIDEELSRLLLNSDQIVVIRNLLLLSRCKPIKWYNYEISRCLSQCLTCDWGLINLINAVVDCDQTSQKETTYNQRYQAIATIVSAMPQLCCSLTQYFESIGPQVLHLLINSNPFYWKIGSMIVSSLENRNQKLTQEFIIEKVLNVFLIPNKSDLTINNAIEIIHHLINSRIDAKKFISIVSHLFYIRVILEESLSHYKSLLDDILVDIFISIDESVYLLDNILYNYSFQINVFETYIVDDVIGVKFKEEENHKTIRKGIKTDTISEELINIKQIDQIVQFVTHLIVKMSETFKLDLFLLLLERMTFSGPSLLTCSIVDSLHESVSQIINKYSEKSIIFIVSTFHRLSIQNTSPILPNNDEFETQSDVNFGQMQQNSLTMCLQIVKILLKEKHKLSEKDILQLKQCIHSLEILSKSESFDETSKKIAIDLKNQIEICDIPIKRSDFDETESKFETAMNQLNDNLMPVRAHALIQLKQLIYAKNSDLLNNKIQLINALKMCLSDSESYIYLSAINTLSSLAILCTDDVLPILIEEFNDSQRTIEERVKVGEVLVQLSKYIGDYAHYYSPKFINCFLIGTKSESEAIRISSLSNLGQFCGVLKFALRPYIVELMLCIECLLKTDDCIEVKRASVMFLCLMLRGIDNNTIQTIEDQLKTIYKLLRNLYSTTIDDILQLHSQLAIEEIDRIARTLLTPNKELIKNIKVLSL